MNSDNLAPQIRSLISNSDIDTWYPLHYGVRRVNGGLERGPKRNVSQERIRVHPRAGEAEAAVKSGGIPEERVGKKHAPASGRGEGTSADAREREKCTRSVGTRGETREQKRVP